MNRSRFPLDNIPQKCAAAECRDLAASGTPLYSPRRRNGLMGLRTSRCRWMDTPSTEATTAPNAPKNSTVVLYKPITDDPGSAGRIASIIRAAVQNTKTAHFPPAST